MAEYREIRHIPASLNRSLNSKKFTIDKIPKEFTLNNGHVMFFYDKGRYILERYLLIQAELIMRGYNLDFNKANFNCKIFQENNWFNDWNPGKEDIKLVCDRINNRIQEKPHLYKDKERFLNYYRTL